MTDIHRLWPARSLLIEYIFSKQYLMVGNKIFAGIKQTNIFLNDFQKPMVFIFGQINVCKNIHLKRHPETKLFGTVIR